MSDFYTYVHISFFFCFLLWQFKHLCPQVRKIAIKCDFRQNLHLAWPYSGFFKHFMIPKLWENCQHILKQGGIRKRVILKTIKLENNQQCLFYSGIISTNEKKSVFDWLAMRQGVPNFLQYKVFSIKYFLSIWGVAIKRLDFPISRFPETNLWSFIPDFPYIPMYGKIETPTFFIQQENGILIV